MSSERVSVPFLPVDSAKPNMCIANVEEHVEKHGGEAVLGWAIVPDRMWETWTHHVVWRAKDGKLFDVTPKYQSTWLGLAVNYEDITFVIDQSAKFIGEKPNRRSLPNRVYQLVDDPRIREACSALQRSETYHHAGEYDKSDYWTERAEKLANQYLKQRGQWIVVPKLNRVPAGWRIGG